MGAPRIFTERTLDLGVKARGRLDFLFVMVNTHHVQPSFVVQYEGSKTYLFVPSNGAPQQPRLKPRHTATTFASVDKAVEVLRTVLRNNDFAEGVYNVTRA